MLNQCCAVYVMYNVSLTMVNYGDIYFLTSKYAEKKCNGSHNSEFNTEFWEEEPLEIKVKTYIISLGFKKHNAIVVSNILADILDFLHALLVELWFSRCGKLLHQLWQPVPLRPLHHDSLTHLCEYNSDSRRLPKETLYRKNIRSDRIQNYLNIS